MFWAMQLLFVSGLLEVLIGCWNPDFLRTFFCFWSFLRKHTSSRTIHAFSFVLFSLSFFRSLCFWKIFLASYLYLPFKYHWRFILALLVLFVFSVYFEMLYWYIFILVHFYLSKKKKIEIIKGNGNGFFRSIDW